MASRTPVIEEIGKIYDYLSNKSDSIAQLMKNEPDWEYMLILKSITHSDLLNSGKRNGPDESIEKNYLYYLSVSEMKEIEQVRKKEFEDAKQSNISVPNEFFDFIGMPQLQRREGAQTTQHVHPIVNDYADVYLVNDTLKYFDINYTKKVFDKLGKHPTSWNYDEYGIELSGKFTPIKLTHAIHGLGTSEDEVFKNLRRSIFKSDILCILLRRKKDKKEVYIMLEKNPRFVTLRGESNASWEKFVNNCNKQEMFNLLKKNDLSAGEVEKTRKNQGKWKNLLAEEMMSYTTTDDEIFCPLTYITANYSSAATLFRASHIKAFNECNVDEAFDINNGILMIANADALFDKHLITISDDGEIIFSFLLEKDGKLIQELRLTERVFKAILNNKRNEYLKIHREVFENKENKRKMRLNMENDSIYDDEYLDEDDE